MNTKKLFFAILIILPEIIFKYKYTNYVNNLASFNIDIEFIEKTNYVMNKYQTELLNLHKYT